MASYPFPSSGGLLEVGHQPTEPQKIAVDTESINHAHGYGGQVGNPTEGFPGGRVREVDLDEGAAHPDQRVPEGHARVGEGSRVHQVPVHPFGALLDPVQKHPLMIRLMNLDLHPQLGGEITEGTVDVPEGRGPVDLGFPTAE